MEPGGDQESSWSTFLVDQGSRLTKLLLDQASGQANYGKLLWLTNAPKPPKKQPAPNDPQKHLQEMKIVTKITEN